MQLVNGDQQAGPDQGVPLQEEPEDHPMEWDEQVCPLPAELAKLWAGVQAGTRKLPLATVLETFPKFAELPTRPAEKNFRSHSKSQWVRQLKSYQQTLLHILRMWSTLYTLEDDQDADMKFRMSWQLCAELFHKLQHDRKEASIPGCTPASSTPLFEKDNKRN